MIKSKELTWNEWVDKYIKEEYRKYWYDYTEKKKS